MNRYLIPCLLLTGTACADTAVQRIEMGDGNVRGTAIGNYDKTWHQCSFADGVWTNAGTVRERATVIGPLLRHQQFSTQPDGKRAVATTYFEHRSLSPLRMELAVTDPAGNPVANVSREFDADGYRGEINMANGDSKPVEGHLSANMYHGAVLGLPLAAMDIADGGVEFDASMVNFNARYRVVATSEGPGTIEHDGKRYDARMVDVEWFHENGDVYPPGPDASGGRYWLRVGDDEALPYVLRYKTDTYAVEFFAEACPE